MTMLTIGRLSAGVVQACTDLSKLTVAEAMAFIERQPRSALEVIILCRVLANLCQDFHWSHGLNAEQVELVNQLGWEKP